MNLVKAIGWLIFGIPLGLVVCTMLGHWWYFPLAVAVIVAGAVLHRKYVQRPIEPPVTSYIPTSRAVQDYVGADDPPWQRVVDLDE